MAPDRTRPWKAEVDDDRVLDKASVVFDALLAQIQVDHAHDFP